jgi:hypothetical protein
LFLLLLLLWLMRKRWSVLVYWGGGLAGDLFCCVELG